MPNYMIEQTVSQWTDAERHAFWDLVGFKVSAENMDPEEAIADTYSSAAYEEMYGS